MNRPSTSFAGYAVQVIINEPGKRENVITQHILLVIVSPGRDHSRLGITVSRKVGNAVCRNRIKRWIRDLFRNNYKQFGLVMDISIIAKRQAGHLSHLQVDRELLIVFARLETDDHD